MICDFWGFYFTSRQVSALLRASHWSEWWINTPSLVCFNGPLKLVLLYITKAKHFWNALEAFWNACRERKCSLMRMWTGWMDVSPDGCCRHCGMSCLRRGTKHTREILALPCFTTGELCHACWELTLKQERIRQKMSENWNTLVACLVSDIGKLASVATSEIYDVGLWSLI